MSSGELSFASTSLACLFTSHWSLLMQVFNIYKSNLPFLIFIIIAFLYDIKKYLVTQAY